MRYLFRFRFAEIDREKYGDGTYELDCSPDGLSKVPVGMLEDFEEQTGMRVLGDWLDALGSGQLKAVRAYMWLARRFADPDDPAVKFADFQPNVLAVMNSGDFEFIADAEGNAPSPAPNRKTPSRRRSGTSSTAARRRQSAS